MFLCIFYEILISANDFLHNNTDEEQVKLLEAFEFLNIAYFTASVL